MLLWVILINFTSIDMIDQYFSWHFFYLMYDSSLVNYIVVTIQLFLYSWNSPFAILGHIYYTFSPNAAHKNKNWLCRNKYNSPHSVHLVSVNWMRKHEKWTYCDIYLNLRSISVKSNQIKCITIYIRTGFRVCTLCEIHNYNTLM